MSIADRLIHLVRANLSSLSGHEAEAGEAGAVRIEELSEEQLEAELRRRRLRREGAERAARHTSYADEEWYDEQAAETGSGRFRTTGRRAGSGSWRHGAGSRSNPGVRAQNSRLAKLYAQLECPYGADLDTVRKSYRGLMRKYHPDMHGQDPAKQRVATELSQRLTQAYNELRQILSPG